MHALLRSLVLLLLLLAVGTNSALANKIDKGGSGKGEVNPTTFNCTLTEATAACVAFSETSATTALWTNILPQFDSDGNVISRTEVGPFDLFLVNTPNPVTFQLTSPSVTFGSFLCGSDPTMTDQLNGFCTTTISRHRRRR